MRKDWASSEHLIIDYGDSPSNEGDQPELLTLDFCQDIQIPGIVATDCVGLDRATEKMEIDLPTPESSKHTQFPEDPLFSLDQWINSRAALEADLLATDLKSNFFHSVENPHVRSLGSRSTRPSTLLISAMIHVFFLCFLAYYAATQGSGSASHAGNVITVRITPQEDLIPQDETPASVNSAGSAASIAKNTKTLETSSAQPLKHTPDILETSPQADRPAMTDVQEPPKKKDEKKESEKELTEKMDESLRGDGPQNSMASIPSTASVERQFIPASGQGGEAFESKVLSAIREAIFFPKKALTEGHHGESVIAFTINKDGSVSHLIVKKSSGSWILDEASIKIIQKAAKKFPPIPNNLNAESLDYVVPILFKKRLG